MGPTNVKARAIVRAIQEAQQLANTDGRTYLIARGARGQRPLIERAADLGILASFLGELVDAGRILLVAPLGQYRGVTAAEIIEADRAGA